MNLILKKAKNLSKDYSIVFVLIVMMIFFSITSPYFMTKNNMINILFQSATIAIAALGMAVCMISGNFDLSLGQNICLSSIVAAKLMKDVGTPIVIAVLAGVALSVLVGACNGVLITYCRIPAFMATLGMMNICKGMARIISNAVPISKLPAGIRQIGTGYLGPIPNCVIILLVLYIVMAYLTENSKFFRCIYQIGGNENAAYYSGINVRKYRIATYMLCGFFASISAFLLYTKLDSATLTNGGSYEFDAVIACVIGGISLTGGKGKIFNALFGSIFLITFFNGMTMLSVDSFWQDVIKGVVLLLSMGVDVYRSRAKD